jgi:CRP/FNR family transcriptional regulator, cyclic AMP receptor protein
VHVTRWAVLDGVAPRERQGFLDAARRRRFTRGETIFHEGDPADTVHLLDAGRVAVRVATPHGDVAILTILGPGEVFGELALLNDVPRTATVTALEACETLSLHRRDFERLRATNRSVDRFLAAALARQVARLSGLVVDAHFLPAPTRVLRRLADLVEAFDDGGTPVIVPLTQEDLAHVAGTTRSTVNQVLQRAEHAGAVQVRRGRIEVVDPSILRSQAD